MFIVEFVCVVCSAARHKYCYMQYKSKIKTRASGTEKDKCCCAVNPDKKERGAARKYLLEKSVESRNAKQRARLSSLAEIDGYLAFCCHLQREQNSYMEMGILVSVVYLSLVERVTVVFSVGGSTQKEKGNKCRLRQ